MENNIEKAVKAEVSKDTLLEVVKELQEIIIGMIEVEEEETESETEDADIEITPANPSPLGNPEEDNVNWPVSKSNNIEDYQSNNKEEDKEEVKKESPWGGAFRPKI